MSMRFKGGVISATPPTITPPVDGEGGSASGIWSLQTQFQNADDWPKPVLARELYSWGFNDKGQLGLGDTANRSSPVQVGALTTWEKVASGGVVSFGIKTDGTMWSWGTNIYGVLGANLPYGNRSSPVQIGALTTWAKVTAGAYDTSSGAHALAIKTDGTLWAWGASTDGQSGLGNTTSYSSPKQVGALTWAEVSAADKSTLAIRTNGTLWAWGLGQQGVLGINSTTNRSSPTQVGSLTTWAKVSTARLSSGAIKTDGTLWTWGFNGNGQLGLGNTTSFSSPVQVGALTNWADLSMGPVSSFAIKTDGTLWAWGYGSQGRLGLGNNTAYSSPKQVGALTNWSKVSGNARLASPTGGVCLALKTDGTLWSWGTNQVGQAGLGDTLFRNSPVQVGSLTTWRNIAAGNATSLATTKG